MKPEPSSKAPQIQRADPGAKAKAQWILLGVVVLGVVAFALSILFEQQIGEWALALVQQSGSPVKLLVFALFIVMLPMVIIAAWVFREGTRVVRARRIPHPGQKVIKDTPVVEGDEAVRRGRTIQVVAVLIGLLSLAIPFVPSLVMLFTR